MTLKIFCNCCATPLKSKGNPWPPSILTDATNNELSSSFYQLLLFIGYPILLGGSKLGYEVLDLLGLGEICFGHGADGDFILDDGHKL